MDNLTTAGWSRVERREAASIIVSLPAWWIEENSEDPQLRRLVHSTVVSAIEEIRGSGIDPGAIATPVRDLLEGLLDAVTRADFVDVASAAVNAASEFFNGAEIDRTEPRSAWRVITGQHPAAKVSDMERWRSQLDTPPIQPVTASEPPSVRMRAIRPAR